MLTKFEAKSSRVKGLAFHPTRPWILASLHCGSIHLYDYISSSLLDKFEEHEGPVRGVAFHPTQGLFLSGGDDYKIKLWDIKSKKVLYTFLGHLDYIRTVQFHHEFPWFLSASDDQTIRLWNYLNRSCLHILTGHNHYVMSASFHCREDLIVSASLDQTIRVWDISGLRKKMVRGSNPSQFDNPHGNNDLLNNNMVSKFNQELFGSNEINVKYVLEGHERGVNWASFHPTLPLIVSGADDRQVKLWRTNESKAWEMDTMRGHTNNVSCVLFHPRHELIISNSEDKTIRVWDTTKRIGVQTFRRENDRFWILAAHPEQNLLAAGHDTGLTVFKLERERPAYDLGFFTTSSNTSSSSFSSFSSFSSSTTTSACCFYIRDRYLRVYDFTSGKDLPLASLRRSSSTITPGIGGGPRSLLYNSLNKNEYNFLILSDIEGGSYELLTLSNIESLIHSSSSNASNANSTISINESQDIRRGSAISAVFISRDRFIILDKSKQIIVKNYQNEVIKKIMTNITGIEALFPANSNSKIILKTEERVILYDLTAKKVINELIIPRIKYIYWNQDNSLVALVSKHQIVLATKNFDHLCTINETIRIKGGAWDASSSSAQSNANFKSFFVYSTSNHIKYLLPNGDRGIIRSLDQPVYITKVTGKTLYCLDREGKMRQIELDLIEAFFKLALLNNNYNEVMRIIKQNSLCGQGIIQYLKEKGYPEVALFFVNEKKTRFDLAIACGNLQVALSVAFELNEEESWLTLGEESLRHGNFEVVEMCYQKTKQFEQLSFLYLLTGQVEKLKKMLKVAEMRQNNMAIFHTSLYLGDINERVKVLEACNQPGLAYLAAATHGLEDQAARLADVLTQLNLPVPAIDPNATLLMPPIPILPSENWPLLAVAPSYLSSSSTSATASTGKSSGKFNIDEDEEDDRREKKTNWDDEDDIFDDEDSIADKKKKKAPEPKKKSAWEDDDLDLSDEDGIQAEEGYSQSHPGSTSTLSLPASFPPISSTWVSESTHASDHFAAGAAESGIHLLNRQIGAINVKEMREEALSLFLGTHSFLPMSLFMPPLKQPLCKKIQSQGNAISIPLLSLNINNILDLLKQAYRAFSNAEFSECQNFLFLILRRIPLINTNNKTEGDDLKELLVICREYLLAIKIRQEMDLLSQEGERDEAEEERVNKRLIELAAYFTHCNLQPAHLLLALKSAMTISFKNKNYINAASFARRLLALPEANNNEKHAELLSRAKKALQKSEQNGRNLLQINYDERNPFKLDINSLQPIYKGSQSPLLCSYCGSATVTAEKGSLCTLCNIGSIGVETVGLVTFAPRRR